jgi:hypothetical protein
MKTFIIGGGSSVTPKCYETLKKYREKGAFIFGVNNAYRFIDLDALVYLDRVAFDFNEHGQENDIPNRNRVLVFKDLKTYNDLKCIKYVRWKKQDDEIAVIPRETFKADREVREGVFCGTPSPMSGIAAVSIALQLGHKDVCLVGFDGGIINGKSHHFHEFTNFAYEKNNKHFEAFRGQPITNCSTESKIETFAKKPLAELAREDGII